MEKKKQKTYILRSNKGEECTVTRDTIARAREYLCNYRENEEDDSDKGSCCIAASPDTLDDTEIPMYPRQLLEAAGALRTALMTHEWNDAIPFLYCLNDACLERYFSTVVRATFMLVLNHPNTSEVELDQYLRATSNYIVQEDIDKFLKTLFLIRDEKIDKPDPGKCHKKSDVRKLVDEDYFSVLDRKNDKDCTKK